MAHETKWPLLTYALMKTEQSVYANGVAFHNFISIYVTMDKYKRKEKIS